MESLFFAFVVLVFSFLFYLFVSQGIGDEANSAVREACATALAEFQRYAIKQTSKKEMLASDFGADTLLRALKV